MQSDSQGGIEIAGETDSVDGLEAAIRAAAADVVIWGVDAGSLERVRGLVVADPGLKVVALETDEGCGVLVALRAELEELTDVGVLGLVEASRRIDGWRTGLSVAQLADALAGARAGRAAC